MTAFVGATIFELGSVLLMLEAVNENRADCFGWALEEVLEDELSLSGHHHASPRRTVMKIRRHDERRECSHSHTVHSSWLRGNDGNAVGARDDDEGIDHAGSNTGSGEQQRQQQQQQPPRRAWAWWPTGYELRTHYLRDVGFLACAAQTLGATVFWISGFTGLPGVLDRLSVPAGEDGAYWTPQVVGGTGFIVSSVLFMLECQRRWYLPAPGVLGWHIGLWNLVGALGFTLCGALGFAIDDPPYEWASAMATFVGSWAFLVRLVPFFVPHGDRQLDCPTRPGTVVFKSALVIPC